MDLAINSWIAEIHGSAPASSHKEGLEGDKWREKERLGVAAVGLR
eukprot:COSAG02_NODE_915_length_15986_cov_16.498584_5_plen_45_part_00